MPERIPVSPAGKLGGVVGHIEEPTFAESMIESLKQEIEKFKKRDAPGDKDLIADAERTIAYYENGPTGGVDVENPGQPVEQPAPRRRRQPA